MSDNGLREWRFYLDDMIGFAEKVIAYTHGLDQAAFVASGLNDDATLRNLELIGEAANHIPAELRANNPQIPWRLIIATRNRLIHSYLGIDNDTLWSIIRSDVSDLLPKMLALRKSAGSQRPRTPLVNKRQHLRRRALAGQAGARDRAVSAGRLCRSRHASGGGAAGGGDRAAGGG